MVKNKVIKQIKDPKQLKIGYFRKINLKDNIYKALK